MSDSTRLTGRLTFTRALTWREYRDNLAAIDDDDHVLAFTETREEVDTDDGPMLRRTATGLEPHEIHGTAYGRGAEMELADMARVLQHIGVRIEGWLYRSSGEHLERMRVHYDPTTVRVESSLTVWPDGTSAYVPVQHPHGLFIEPGTGPALFETRAVRTIDDLLTQAKH